MDWLSTIMPLVDPMMARQAIEDVELLESLDFIPQCEVPSCEEQAVWVGTTRCCKYTRFGCELHRRQTDAVLASDPKLCGHCRTSPHPGIRWIPFA